MCIYKHIHMHIHRSIYIYIYVHVYNIYTYIHTYVYINVYVYAYACVRAYTSKDEILFRIRVSKVLKCPGPRFLPQPLTWPPKSPKEPCVGTSWVMGHDALGSACAAEMTSGPAQQSPGPQPGALQGRQGPQSETQACSYGGKRKNK